jgi:glutamine amidotransferase
VIALIDYGAGNLTSVRKALAALGAEFVTPTTVSELRQARAIIVPGVGHFDRTRAIDSEWRGAIRHALDRHVPLFGICLGMQWLFEGSTEAPGVPGLGVFAGMCERLSPNALKVPHVGWNALVPTRPSDTMAGVAPDSQVYFTHSYIAPVTSVAAATTTYGVTFASAVEDGHIAGVQFHPEKSGEVGLRILRNWLTLTDAV